MTTTRQEAERIAETDDVASAIGYLVESHSTNAAVDLVHAVMNAMRTQPAQADKWIASFDTPENFSRYWEELGNTAIEKQEEFTYDRWKMKQFAMRNCVSDDKLGTLVDNFLLEWDDETGDRCLLDDAVDALRDARKDK